MAFAISRQIKLRSVEQAIFKPSYNRLNFFIQPDGLSTDLSQSYLSMRVYLTNAITNTRITTAQLQNLLANNLVVSFGNNDQTYTPASLIRVARLFANKGNELLEEVNFSNVLTQSVMNQLCNDWETIESTNILTGSTSQLGHGSSLPASLSAFTQNPTEVHIYLRDLFGVCRHSNFELAVTDGLNITIELEDKQNLFRVSTLGDFQQINVPDVSGNTADAILPASFVNPAEPGYSQNVSSLANTPIATGQFVAPSSNFFVDPSGNKMIQYPKEGFWFDAETWFEQPAVDTAIDGIIMTGTYDADQLTALGFVADAWVKLRYSISSSFVGAGNVAPKEFVYMAQIESTTPGATAAIVFNTAYSLWIDGTVPVRTVNDVVVFKGLELLRPNEVIALNVGTTPATISSLLALNTLAVDLAQYQQFQSLGLITTTGESTALSFDLGVQMETAAATATLGAHIMPDVITNEMSPNIRKIYSNQLTKLPTQGSHTRITDIVQTDISGGGHWNIFFSSWGSEAGTSIQPVNIYPTGDETFAQVAGTSANIFIWNVQNLQAAPNAVDLSGNAAFYDVIPSFLHNLSYEIDKFELVLIQSSIDPKNRMPSPFIYSTWKLETATIETAQPTYARQFILEENVYNCMLLTPAWNSNGTDRGSLISTKRGVSYYRYSVNQVNQTNRDIYLTTFRSNYPSTLYIDRLTDTFSNSDYILRSPMGIKGVNHFSDPVIIYPLKIYHAVSEQAYVMGAPGGATVQINMFSDTAMGERIVPGNIFFFKQILKQLA